MISVCILHKNDMLNLFRAVASVHEFASEVIVADSGAHDYTALLSAFSKAKIIRYVGDFSFSKARNLALDNAKSEWVLFLDSDEELALGQAEKVKGLISSSKSDAYALMVVNLFSDGTWSNFPVTRLFRNLPFVRYEKEIHETVNYSFASHNIIPQIADIFITHYGYVANENKAYKKTKALHIPA